MNSPYNFNPKSGDIWEVEIPEGVGHQQKDNRPMLITSNNIGNYYSPMVDGVLFTTKKQNNKQPTHAFYKAGEAGLAKDSVLLAECKYSANKFQLIRKIGTMNNDQLLRASTAIVLANPITVMAYEAGVQHTPAFQRVAMAY